MEEYCLSRRFLKNEDFRLIPPQTILHSTFLTPCNILFFTLLINSNTITHVMRSCAQKPLVVTGEQDMKKENLDS